MPYVGSMPFESTVPETLTVAHVDFEEKGLGRTKSPLISLAGDGSSGHRPRHVENYGSKIKPFAKAIIPSPVQKTTLGPTRKPTSHLPQMSSFLQERSCVCMGCSVYPAFLGCC